MVVSNNLFDLLHVLPHLRRWSLRWSKLFGIDSALRTPASLPVELRRDGAGGASLCSKIYSAGSFGWNEKIMEEIRSNSWCEGRIYDQKTSLFRRFNGCSKNKKHQKNIPWGKPIVPSCAWEPILDTWSCISRASTLAMSRGTQTWPTKLCTNSKEVWFGPMLLACPKFLGFGCFFSKGRFPSWCWCICWMLVDW